MSSQPEFCDPGEPLRSRRDRLKRQGKLPPLVHRAEATQATTSKYGGKAFSWANSHTCIHMLRFQLRKMGHQPPPLPRIKSAIGAKRALVANGWDGCAQMLDSMLSRIPYASATTGDVMLMESEDPSGGAIVISVGQRVIGQHDEADGIVVMEPRQIVGAWRV